MKEFDALLTILDRLLAPDGCPWDKQQTLTSIRGAVVEEAYEVVDAIDSQQKVKITEELGDLLWASLFLCRLAEKEGKGSLDAILQEVSEKLIRRHPHIFGEAKVDDAEGVALQWDEIKKGERPSHHSVLDSVPKEMSPLLRAQKILQRMKKAGFSLDSHLETKPQDTEVALGNSLLTLLKEAIEGKVNADLALHKALAPVEAAFRQWEERENESQT